MPVSVADLISACEAAGGVGDRIGDAAGRRPRDLAWLDPGHLLTQAMATGAIDAMAEDHVSAVGLAFDPGAVMGRTAAVQNQIPLAADPSGMVAAMAGVPAIEVEAAWRADPGVAVASLLDPGAAAGRAALAGTPALDLVFPNQAASGVVGRGLGLPHSISAGPFLPSSDLAFLGTGDRVAGAETLFEAGRLATGPLAVDRSWAFGSDVAILAMPRWDPVVELPSIPWLRPGTPDADLFLLLRGDGEPEEQLAALERMVDRVRWAPHGAARAALAARARDEQASPAEIKRRELRAAVVLVVGAVEEPQYHRFGNRWLVGPDGRKDLVRPYHDLDLDLLWEWFLDEVPKAAEAALLDRPYPATGDPWERGLVAPVDPSDGGIGDPLGAAEADPLHLLLERERRSDDAKRLLALVEQASPRQRELLALLWEGFEVPEAARRLGMAPATARQQLLRLRRKAM